MKNFSLNFVRGWLLTLLMSFLLVACSGTDADPISTTPPETATDTITPTDEPIDPPTAESTSVGSDTEETTNSDSDHEHSGNTHTYTDEVDISLFYDGALSEDVAVVDCTLSDGTETMCYEITIAGYPANDNVGPFCPPTIESTADEGGIWFDGNNVYDVDGEFILSLADIYNDPNWQMYDDDGNVNITETAEEFDLAARPNVDPSLQNHCVEGRIEWLENGEPVPTTVTIPMTPVMADRATAGGNWGVTLNGVIIAAQAPVGAILGAYTIAAFDDCGGHINPVDGYHLHGAVGCSEVGEASEGETPAFAYAMDGYRIHSSLDADAEASADLDECNGHATDELGYHYHANPAEENGVLTCFMGVTVQTQGGGRGGQGGDGGPPTGGGRGGAGGPPNFAAAAEILGVTEQELRDALGGPPPDFAAAAETLGLSEQELQAALAGEGAPPADGGEMPEMMDEAAATTTFQLEAWGDNWFAAYLGEELIVEDSVSILTERSFNSETATFEASYPLQLNFILKDFIENDTGLEYIGERNQQMGDGGFIMQLTDLGSGDVVGVSNGDWACTVIHEAPLDKSCENEANPEEGVVPCTANISDEPAGWMSADFDDSTWTATTVHSASAVDPKQGYNDIAWDGSAEFIWGPDLETNNTLLCRVIVSGE